MAFDINVDTQKFFENDLIQSSNPILQKINSELSGLVEYARNNDTPTMPYINSLLQKYSNLAKDDFTIADDGVTLSHFLAQIYKITPYIQTNAPLPRSLRFPIVG